MYQKLLVILVLVLVSLLNVSNAQNINDSNLYHHNDSPSFLYLNLKENKQRIGFETFFWITNLFIDNYFVPNIPSEINNKTDLISFKEKIIETYSLDDGYISLAKIPLKIYPSLSTFVLVCLLVGVFVPILGVIVCFYRCCCRSSKFNPYDRKLDSFLRKFNSFFMFIILTVALLAIITLFFTNQNSSTAIGKSSAVLKTNLNEFKKIESEKLPIFIKNVEKNVKTIENDTSKIITSSLERLTQLYLKSMLIDMESLENLDKQFTDATKELRFNLTTNDTVNLIEAFKSFSNDNQKRTIDKFLDEINSNNSALNFLNGDLSIENQIKKLVENSNIDSSFNKKLEDIVTTSLKLLQKTIDNTTDQYVSEKNLVYVERFEKYYEFLYIALIGICLFVLFLFILFSIGMVGICARRKHKNIKQTCHRGVSANLLCSGAVFYFLFAWTFIIASICLFVPGITFRHFICKPLIELDQNNIFNAIYKANIESDFNFTKALNECDKFGKSNEINHRISHHLIQYVSLNSSEETIYNLVSNKLPELRNTLDKLDENLNEEELNRLSKDIEEYNMQFTEISNFIPQENVEQVSLMNEILEYLSLIKKIIHDTRSIKQKLKDLKTKSNYESLEGSFKNKLKKEIQDNILPEFKTSLESLVAKMMQALPSCRFISNFYKDVLVTGCFEYLDNINTFWFTLLVTLLLYFLLLAFAISQADLFRKNYPYDQITNESPMMEPKYHHPSKNLNYDIPPIDAFRIEDYSNPNINKQNNQLTKSNRSPPPKYYND